MLADIDLLSAPTDPAALLDLAPLGLDDDYLYATLVHPLRRASLNAANVHLAYGTQTGSPKVPGAVIHAPA